MLLGLRKEVRKVPGRWEKARQGLGREILRFLQGGRLSKAGEPRCMGAAGGVGWLRNLPLEERQAWAVTTRRGLRGQDLALYYHTPSSSPRRNTLTSVLIKQCPMGCDVIAESAGSSVHPTRWALGR